MSGLIINPHAFGAVVAPFHPLDLSPDQLIHAFLDSSITQSGGFASQIDDLTGNGYHYVQATGADQLAVITGAVNGNTVLRNTGGNFMTCASIGLNGLTDTTIITVYKVASTTSGSDAMVSMGTNAECRFEGKTNFTCYGDTGIDWNGTSYWTSVNDTYESYFLLTDSSTNNAWVDGTASQSRTNVAAWATGAGDYGLCACNDGGRDLHGDFVARFVKKSRITDAERLQLLSYYNGILGK